MTCQHCATSVTEEGAGFAGVESVDVDLASRRRVVVGNVSDYAVRAAVDEAGYTVS